MAMYVTELASTKWVNRLPNDVKKPRAAGNSFLLKDGQVGGIASQSHVLLGEKTGRQWLCDVIRGFIVISFTSRLITCGQRSIND